MRRECPKCGSEMKNPDDLTSYETLTEHVTDPNQEIEPKPYWVCGCFDGFIGIEGRYYSYDPQKEEYIDGDDEIMTILKDRREMKSMRVDVDQFCDWLFHEGWSERRIDMRAIPIIKKKVKEINWQIKKYLDDDQSKEESISKIENIASKKPQLNPSFDERVTHKLREYIDKFSMVNLDGKGNSDFHEEKMEEIK